MKKNNSVELPTVLRRALIWVVNRVVSLPIVASESSGKAVSSELESDEMLPTIKTPLRTPVFHLPDTCGMLYKIIYSDLYHRRRTNKKIRITQQLNGYN